MVLVDKVLTKRMRFFPGLYKYYKMLEIFLENSFVQALFLYGEENWKLNVLLKNGSSSDFNLHNGFVCLFK